jgi:hypothetical protein
MSKKVPAIMYDELVSLRSTLLDLHFWINILGIGSNEADHYIRHVRAECIDIRSKLAAGDPLVPTGCGRSTYLILSLLTTFRHCASSCLLP